MKINDIKTEPKKRYTLILATGYNKIVHKKLIEGSCNGEIFLQFMKECVNKLFRGNKWGIIIDNARIHHYWKFKKYINKITNSAIIYNVPYSPETNPIEKIFKDIKKILRIKQ